MYGCPGPIVTALIPVGNECSSWRNEDSCYGRYQADPYVAKIKYWQGLKVPPDLEYCDGLLNRKVPSWLCHKRFLYTRLDFWLQYGWRSKEGWTSDFETKVYWSDWSNVHCSYTFLAYLCLTIPFQVEFCQAVLSPIIQSCPLCQICKQLNHYFVQWGRLADSEDTLHSWGSSNPSCRYCTPQAFFVVLKNSFLEYIFKQNCQSIFCLITLLLILWLSSS